MNCRSSALACIVLLITPALVRAHYLWLSTRVVDEQPVLELVFEESPRPGDGHYLDPIVERGKTWVRTRDMPQPRAVGMEEMRMPDLRWLRGKLDDNGLVAADSYVKWGVYRYGNTDALLHYYAKYIETAEALPAPARQRSEKLDLDIVVEESAEGRQVAVFWRGEPAANREIHLRGPQGRREKLTTDAAGRAKLTVAHSGPHTFRVAVVEQNKAGEFEGKPFTQVRHNATLTIRLTAGQ